jgi:hypothetical protein
MLSILTRQRGHRIRRMSAYGTKRTSQRASSMSALGDKADIEISGRNVCFWHKADIQPSLTDVRFWGYSGHLALIGSCLLLTKSGRRKSRLPRAVHGYVDAGLR